MGGHKMRSDFKFAEKYRDLAEYTPWESKPGDRFGIFVVRRGNTALRVIVTDGAVDELPEHLHWEHVSVTGLKKGKPHTPTWEEMCYIKKLFFDDDDCVMQLHPPASDHINIHNNCLHLWRPVNQEIPMPPKEYV
jgi:hypothetical protein